jgi:hypothetical protein
MPAYPNPAPGPEVLLNFEDQIEQLLLPLFEADSYLSNCQLQFNTSRSVDVKVAPRIDIHAAVGQNMDYLSFILQGSPARQTPNAYNADLVVKVATSRQLDGTGANLHGPIRGRIRYIMSAPANLLSVQATYPYLQILEILPGQTIPGLSEQRDQDTSALMFRMKFAINDWAWPIVVAQPVSLSVKHPSGGTFGFEALLGSSTTFQWQVSTDEGATWSNTTDGATYSGSQTASLQILSSTTGMNGYQYRCLVSNSYGKTVATAGGTLNVS